LLAFITPLSPLILKRGILSVVILPLNIPLKVRGTIGGYEPSPDPSLIAFPCPFWLLRGGFGKSDLWVTHIFVVA